MRRAAAFPGRRVGLARMIPAALLALAAVPVSALQDMPVRGPAAGIDPGALVRIRTTTRVRIDGRLLRGDRDAVDLDAGGRTETIPTSEIDALWRAGRAVGTGAWIGALAGGVPALAYGALLCHAYTEPGSTCGDWDKIAVLGLLGAGIGGAAGALIGAFVRTWDLRWSDTSVGADIGLTAEGRLVVGFTIGT